MSLQTFQMSDVKGAHVTNKLITKGGKIKANISNSITEIAKDAGMKKSQEANGHKELPLFSLLLSPAWRKLTR